jgi:hypothetical protein
MIMQQLNIGLWQFYDMNCTVGKIYLDQFSVQQQQYFSSSLLCPEKKKSKQT